MRAKGLTALMNSMYSLRDQLLHWDCIVNFQESPMLYIRAPSYAASTSKHLHCGQNLQQYLEEDRIHYEYVEAKTKTL